MKHIGLFEGIGGFSLAAHWMGWETVAWCEWNDFGQRVLRHHFPEAIGHGDITKTDFTPYANKIDILTGGFPCQPYSAAGKRRGKEDDRHLWPEMLRAIREIAPRYVVGENVLGLVNWNGGMVFDEVCADLESEGYEVTPVVIPAAAVNAPHGRDRVWFIARRTTPDTDSTGRQERNDRGQSTNSAKIGARLDDRTQRPCDNGDAPDTESDATNSQCIGRNKKRNDDEFAQESQQKECREQQFSRTNSSQGGWWNFPSQSPVCSGDDGLPRKLDGITFPKWRAESIKAYGNAIVPQVAYELFKAIQLYEQHS